MTVVMVRILRSGWILILQYFESKANRVRFDDQFYVKHQRKRRVNDDWRQNWKVGILIDYDREDCYRSGLGEEKPETWLGQVKCVMAGRYSRWAVW